MMYLGWKSFLFLGVVNLLGGLANAAADNSWWALLNGAATAGCAFIAIDEYENRDRRRS